MPTYSFSEDSFLENEIPLPLHDPQYRRGPSKEFITYEPSSAIFDAEKLDAQAQIVLRALRDIGVSSVRCHYDGGGDEGFAHFDTAFFDDTPKSMSEIAPMLPALAEITPEDRINEGYVIFMGCHYLGGQFDSLTPQHRVEAALDYLAYCLASKLLGDGFGTGEYSMFGAFHADLTSGAIHDEPTEAPQ